MSDLERLLATYVSRISSLEDRVSDLERQEFAKIGYGEMYTYDDALTVSAVTAGTYYTITGLAAGLAASDNPVTVDAVNGTLTVVAGGGGIYEISFVAAGISANKPCELHGSVFVNGSDTEKIGWRRDISTANQIGSAGAAGLYDLAAGDIVTFRLTSSGANTTITVEHGQFFLKRLRL